MDTGDGRKLFVGGLPDVISEDVLRQLFEATGGTVVDISLPRDRNTGRPRGFAFVTMGTAEEAAAARRSLDRSSQAGRSISVREFHAESRQGTERVDRGPRPEPPRGAAPVGGAPQYTRPGPPADRNNDRTLYVSNLPYDVSREELEGLFNEFNAAPIARVHLPTTPEGRGRGFGFVAMESAEAAEQAVVLLRDAGLRGRRVNLSIAHPRGERPPPRPGERGPTDFAPREPERSRGFDEPPPMEGDDRFESFRGGGEDRRRKEHEKLEKAEKKKKAKPAKRAARAPRDNRGRWDPDSWDDD